MLEAIMGLGLLTLVAAFLVQLHGNAVRGVERSSDLSIALDIAEQRAEDIATMGFNGAPTCAGPAGCAASMSVMQPPLPPAGAFQCTRMVDTADVPLPGGVPTAGGVQFRVDAVVGTHPDPQQPDSRVVTVSVCWQMKGRVHQVQTRRMLVDGA